MPRSHICPSCLSELARLRAIPDPHYGLPIVVCPRCTLACVRTKHPDQQFWRAFRKQFRAIRLLFLTCMVTLVSSLALWGMTIWGSEVFANRAHKLEIIRVLKDGDFDDIMAGGVIILVAFLGGVIIRVVYPHRRAFAAISILGMCALLWLTSDLIVMKLIELIGVLGGFSPSPDGPDAAEMFLRVQLFAILIGIAIIGLIPGEILSRLVKAGSTKRFRKIRNKRRRRQRWLD